MRVRIIIIICLITAAGIIENNISADNQYMDAVLKLRGQNKQMVQALKDELKGIQDEIRRKNYKCVLLWLHSWGMLITVKLRF